MPRVLADRVRETSTTTGTGTLSLLGASSTFRGFVAGIATGNQAPYAIVHQSADEWEVGEGTVTDATPDTLSRTKVLASSNAGALVNFSAGTKDVFVTAPAAEFARLPWDPPPSTADAADDELDDTPGQSGSRNGLLGKWSWVNQSGATQDWIQQAIRLNKSGTTSEVSGLVQTIASPTGNWEYRTEVVWAGNVDNTFLGVGLMLRESGTGKIATWYFIRSGATPTRALRLDRWTNATTYGSTPAGAIDIANVLAMRGYLHLSKSSSTLSFRFSHDGVNATQLYSEAENASFTTRPDQVGLVVTSATTAGNVIAGLFRRFRKAA